MAFPFVQGTCSTLSLPATCSAPVLMKLKELDYLGVLVFFCQLLAGLSQRVQKLLGGDEKTVWLH